ncbi:hypothetical protein SynMITS9220_00856 [Synechococcus sp. MIT S9220]|nr:hypothetical protein SynMITS9220_00856 [Synechococcus sp. MIT S9220]
MAESALNYWGEIHVLGVNSGVILDLLVLLPAAKCLRQLSVARMF